jgi:hypothetical protein
LAQNVFLLFGSERHETISINRSAIRYLRRGRRELQPTLGRDGV